MYSKTNTLAGPALIRLLLRSKARLTCNLHENIRLVLVSWHIAVGNLNQKRGIINGTPSIHPIQVSRFRSRQTKKKPKAKLRAASSNQQPHLNLRNDQTSKAPVSEIALNRPVTPKFRPTKKRLKLVEFGLNPRLPKRGKVGKNKGERTVTPKAPTRHWPVFPGHGHNQDMLMVPRRP
jgi:hypothetical protein